MTESRYDLVIVGAGPAGMAAAIAASKSTSSVLMIDEGRAVGGQIWRADVNGKRPAAASSHVAALEGWPGTLMSDATVVDAWTRESIHHLTIMQGGVASHVTTARLILATGARELFLPFPGWTLPGVTGVGGLQALTKGGLDIAGKRIVVAGSGPLIIAVAASLKERGASIVALLEQTTRLSAAAFAAFMVGSPSKLREGAEYLAKLSPTTLSMNSWVDRAVGNRQLTGVEVRDGRKSRHIACDFAAVSYGLVANTDLARLLGCDVSPAGVKVNEQQATSIPGIFAAGDCTGIAGNETAVAEGNVAAGVATAQAPTSDDLKAVAWGRSYAARMASSYAPRDEVLALADDQTVVCRCEDVKLGQIDRAWDARTAKLYTRCGMGACQGRVCGPALQAMRGWQPDKVRPPLQPAPASVFFSSAPNSLGDS